MIFYKTKAEIEVMKEGGKRLRGVVQELKKIIKVGVSTKEIDERAEDLIKKAGGQSSFKKVKSYYWTTCLPINEQIVHTPPSKRTLKDGDLLTVDIGMYFRGYHTDFADSFVVGKSTKEQEKFLRVGRETLYKAIKKLKPGSHLGEVSAVIEKEIYGSGYFIIRQLTGHGIGKKLHEDPYVLGFLDRPIAQTQVIKPGLVVAIEVIYSMGAEEFVSDKGDDWSLSTKDGSLSACFEHTLAVDDKNSLILT